MDHPPTRTCHHACCVLEGFDGVTRLTASAGQVLIHAGHQALGLFFLIGGEVELVWSPTRAREHLEPSAEGLFVPAPAAIEVPAGCTVRVVRDCEMLYVPLSLWLLDESLRKTVEDLRVPVADLNRPQTAANVN